jgi:uncharacterized membrane protein YqjE
MDTGTGAEDSTVNLDHLAAASRQLAGRGLAIGVNRLELLMVELQEERDRLLHAIILVLATALFGFLACLTLTAACVVWLWNWSPTGVLLILTAIYAAAAFGFYRALAARLRDWQILSASLDQLAKDRACLEKALA